MGYLNNDFFPKEDAKEESLVVKYTLDGSVDRHGNPAIRTQTGRWGIGFLILVNQGLATLAFYGVGVNLVLFMTRVIGQNNADAANDVSKWIGTVYLFSLVGALLSDSCWGRFKTCVIFQAIFIVGLAMLSLSTYLFLLNPRGCGDGLTPCDPETIHVWIFNLSLYMVALGIGGYQPIIATFGADQFDEQHPKERTSKIAFFSYFYMAFNIGSLFSNTVLAYYENFGKWGFGFLASTATALMALVLFLSGTPSYRHFKRQENPVSRFCKVFAAAMRKRNTHLPLEEDGLYEFDSKIYSKIGCRMISHTQGFKFLDKAAVSTSLEAYDEEHLCTITQVEEVKCILRLLPIWLCTIMYSVVYTQMASIFVVQGAVMNTSLGGFHIPPAAMSSFNILSVTACVFLHSHILNPIVIKLRKRGLNELERMGIGLILVILAMIVSGIVEIYRLKYTTLDCEGCNNYSSSSLSIFWQIPQFVLIGASEVYMYVPQLEFFNGQAPEGLRSFGSALYTTSMSLGNYASIVIVSIVMKTTTRDNMPGWIPQNLNKGHLEKFYFLLAILTAVDLLVFFFCAWAYKYVGETDKDYKENIDF